jgi:hypothetical protein
MSATNTKSNTKSNIKPFCKVCFDAGKPFDEYQSHYVRDAPGGKVICPTILAQKCRYCLESGHTLSHCKVLKQKKRVGMSISKECNKKEVTTKVSNASATRFAGLFQDDDSECESDHDSERDSNAHENIVTTQHVLFDNSYAAMAAKPAAAVVTKPSPAVAVVVNEAIQLNIHESKRSWADYDTSDDEDMDNYVDEDDLDW